MQNGEMVLTLGEKRALMPLGYYKEISEFIISRLDVDSTIPFLGLVDQVQSVFATAMRGDVSWYFLCVKRDLEARKIIRVLRERDRSQTIRLRKKYKERLMLSPIEVRGVSGPRLDHHRAS
jgi:hypothetical protein